MRIETTYETIYCFKELPDEIQEKAINGLRDLNVDHDWWDFTYSELEELGVKCNSFDTGRAQKIDLEFIGGGHEIAQKILDNHGEECETFKIATEYLRKRDKVIESAPKTGNEFDDEYELDQELDELRDEFKQELSEEYLSILGKEYEYLTSDEAIKESIEANEYEFDIDGNLQ